MNNEIIQICIEYTNYRLLYVYFFSWGLYRPSFNWICTHFLSMLIANQGHFPPNLFIIVNNINEFNWFFFFLFLENMLNIQISRISWNRCTKWKIYWFFVGLKMSDQLIWRRHSCKLCFNRSRWMIFIIIKKYLSLNRCYRKFHI